MTVAEYNEKTTGDELVAKYADQIKGKVVLTTGVSPGGLGAAFAKTVAAGKPALLILAGRNTAKVQQTVDEIVAAHPDVKARALELDLGSFEGARKAAAAVNSWVDVPVIDVLVNNAGVMATDWKLTPDNIESQFATNHLAHFLFTNLIMDKILASSSPRIVNVSSDAHRMSGIRFDDYNFGNGADYNRWLAYGQSKSANILFGLSLVEKLSKRGLQSYSLHPGVIMTNLANHIDFAAHVPAISEIYAVQGVSNYDVVFKTEQEGIATHVYAAFEPTLKERNGAYLYDSHLAPEPVEGPITYFKPHAADPVAAEKLWKLSEKLVGQEFNY